MSTTATFGLSVRDRVHQVDGVLGLGDDVEARVREHARDALAHERRVVGDRDAEGAHERDPLVERSCGARFATITGRR